MSVGKISFMATEKSGADLDSTRSQHQCRGHAPTVGNPPGRDHRNRDRVDNLR